MAAALALREAGLALPCVRALVLTPDRGEIIEVLLRNAATALRDLTAQTQVAHDVVPASADEIDGAVAMQRAAKVSAQALTAAADTILDARKGVPHCRALAHDVETAAVCAARATTGMQLDDEDAVRDRVWTELLALTTQPSQ